jgi:RNA polymerase sigma-70 factor (ECF subfamily)
MNDESCQHWLEELSAYLDGSTPKEVCAEIERHVSGCEHCRALFDTLRQTIRLCHDLPQPDFPATVRERLYQALHLEEVMPVR